MVSRHDVESYVAGMHPADGLHVRETAVGGRHELHLAYYRQGVPADPPMRLGTAPLTQSVWDSGKTPMTDRMYGSKARTRLLVEAVCRFLNTGGSWQELTAAVDCVCQFSGHSSVEVAYDFHLIGSSADAEGVYEHVFARDGCPFAVRWVEHRFVDVVPLADMLRETREAQEDQPHVVFGGDPEGDVVELLGGEGDGNPPEDAGCPAEDVP